MNIKNLVEDSDKDYIKNINLKIFIILLALLYLRAIYYINIIIRFIIILARTLIFFIFFDIYYENKIRFCKFF